MAQQAGREMAEWKKFVREIWYDSFKLWQRGQGVSSFAGAIFSTLLLAVFFFVGPVRFKPEVHWWLGSFSAGSFLFLLLVVAPFRLWKRTNHEIAVLLERLRPRLSLSFAPQRPLFEQLPNQDSILVSVVRVAVRNESNVETIHNVRVVLRDISDRDHAFPNAALTPIDGPATFYLAPGAEQNINVLEYPQQGFDIVLRYADHSLPSTLLAVPGETYVLLIEAQGDGVPSAQLRLSIHVGSKHGIKVSRD
jgi:hypothetical protein